MLNPLQVQNLQTPTGKALPAAELVRALPLNTPATITVQQSAPTPAQAGQFTLQVQLGSKLFQLNSNQHLPPGTQATLTRTTVGQLLLTPTALPAAPAARANPATAQGTPASTASIPPPQTQPATTQQRPVQPAAATQQPLPAQPHTPGQQATASVINSPPAPAAPPSQNPPGQPHTPARQTSAPVINSPPATASQAGQSPPRVDRPAAEPPQPQPQPATTKQASQQTAGQQSQTAVITATIANRGAGINHLLPLNKPVLATLSQTIDLPRSAATAQPTTALPAQASATINGRTVQLNLPQPLTFDGKVLLVRTQGNQVAIQPLTAPIQNQTLQQTINDSLRQVLPAQKTVAESLQQIQAIGSSPGADRQAINGILSALVNLFGIKPDGSGETRGSIAQNLLNGGLFTERNLANPGKPDLSLDFKHQLGQLLKQADKLPELPRQQLQELVQGLLSRVTSNQLESIQNTRVSSDGGIERFFALDLPIRHKEQLENVELKISEHRSQVSEHEWQSLWKVRLHFDLEALGTVDAELVLEHDYRITAHFWCSKADTAAAFSDQLPQFNRQLHRQGYIINAVHCSEGKAPKPGNSVEQLIDVTT